MSHNYILLLQEYYNQVRQMQPLITLQQLLNRCDNMVKDVNYALPDIFAYSHASNNFFYCFLLAIFFIAVEFCLQLKDFTYGK